MTIKEARAVHIGDEVRIKKTGEKVTIRDVWHKREKYIIFEVSNGKKIVHKQLEPVKDTLTDLNKTGNVKALLKLIVENPNLPIVAYVDSEIVADDGYNRWLGSFGSSHIIEYVRVQMYNDYPEMVYRDDTERLEEFLLDGTEITEQEAQDYINGLEWKRAIAVNIDLPEEA